MPPPDQNAWRLEQLRKFLEANPSDAFARYSLAMTHRSMGHLEEALAEFKAVTEKSPDYVPTYLMLGQTLEQLGRKVEAKAAYAQGIAAARKAGNMHALGELTSAHDLITG